MDSFPNYDPSYSTRKNVTPKVLEASFGDGYEQRSPDGLNPIKEEWSIAFNARVQVEADTIESFLVAKGGCEAFLWTAPGESLAKRWKCQAWGREPTQGRPGKFSLTATFKRVYDL